MKVLISGGAGFIGYHLSNRLRTCNASLRILDNLSPQIHGELPDNLDWLIHPQIEYIRGSVVDRDTWKRALDGVDVVVHLAAETGTGQSMYQIAHYNEVNSQGTALLLDIIAQGEASQVKRLVLASSRSVYGEGAYVCPSCGLDPVYPDSRSLEALAAHRWEYECPACVQELAPRPTREDDRVRPASIYAATKYAQEDLVQIACKALGIGYVIFRFQNVYGEGQSLNNPYTGILSIFSTRVRRGLILPLFEDGKESRDFVHVEDVAEAVTLGVSAKQYANAVFNVGSGEASSVQAVADQLSLALGVQPNTQVTHQYRLGDIRHCYADLTRIGDALGFKPGVSLSDGMKRFAGWVMAQPLPEDKLDKANEELKARKLMG